MNGRFEMYVRPHRGFGGAETHDGLTMSSRDGRSPSSKRTRKISRATFSSRSSLCPLSRSACAGPSAKRGFSARLPNFFRKPYGPGWALVGDAAYHKDSITAQGITDAFREAERCAAALDQVFGGARSFDEAMAEYQRGRDERVLPMYEFTCQLATLEPPPPEMQKLIGAIHGRRKAMDAFAQMNAGTISPAEFFAPSNIGELMVAA